MFQKLLSEEKGTIPAAVQVDVICGKVEETGDQIEKAFFGTGFVFRKDDGDCQKMLNYMSRNGYRHHVAFVRGNWSAAIVEAFGNYLGWEIDRI